MKKQARTPPGTLKPSEAAAREAFGPIAQQQVVTLQEQSVTVHVQLPPPALLAEYERVQAGTMDLFIRWSEEEQAHRRRQDELALTANIEAQRRQLSVAESQLEANKAIATYQAETVRSSDRSGQILGWSLCAAAMGLAVYLSLQGHEAVAAVLAALLTAAVIQSFRTLTRQEARTPEASPKK